MNFIECLQLFLALKKKDIGPFSIEQLFTYLIDSDYRVILKIKAVVILLLPSSQLYSCATIELYNLYMTKYPLPDFNAKIIAILFLYL